MRFPKTALIFYVLFSLNGCDSNEVPVTTNELTQTLLGSKTWKGGSATIDGVFTDFYTGLTISFDTNNSILAYTATNGGIIWPASGTWSFVGEDGKRIKRNDGLDIAIEVIEENQLVISYTWVSTTYRKGRTSGSKGLNRIFLN